MLINGKTLQEIKAEYEKNDSVSLGREQEIALVEALMATQWQPIETAPEHHDFDVWSERLGRITGCGFGNSTYGHYGIKGIIYQSGCDSDGAVFELISDATHWMPLPVSPIDAAIEAGKK